MARDRERRRLLRIEPLEQRALLSLTAVCDPILSDLTPGLVTNPNSPIGYGYIPANIQGAYGISSISIGGVSGSGAGQTIAIVDAYNDPNIISDVDSFSTYSTINLQRFNVSGGPTLTVLNENGNTIPNQTTTPTGTGEPSNAPKGTTSWAVEESLDVEWAHSIAPQANIILFEANSTSYTDLMTAVQTAAGYSGVSVVSMSWGGSEFSGETSYDSYFTTPSGHANVAFLVSTGDSGAPGEYPAYSPNVIAVGGTSLTASVSTNAWQSETAWSSGGGGASTQEKEPSYQTAAGVPDASGMRETPDVSFDADPNTGVPIYDSYDFGSGWQGPYGGTSLACPCWAGLIAIADQFRAAEGLSLLSSNNSNGSNYSAQAALYGLYSTSANPYSHGAFHDITSGSNGNPAGTGYDLATGIGTPIANVLVPALAPNPLPDMTVSMTASGSGVFHPSDVGDTFTITVTNSGTAPTSGTVSLVDTLPSGLTATAFTGTGWSVNFTTLTATNSNVLAAGSSYSPLTLTVNVASGASGNLTNTATVSGGGETNTSNDTATDTVTIAPPADLTVSMIDSGGFKQGDTADTYTITVTNSGAGPTAGTVSLVDTLPTGLTATAFSGTGWSVNLSTLTATRSDALGAGASYAALTVTVSVAENAPSSVTNLATVSGGGETNTSNDTASDTSNVGVVMPTITATTPSLTGGTLPSGTTTIAINFSEAMTASGTNGAGTAANYQLRDPGPDGLFGTADDVLVPLSVSYSGTTATLTFAALTENIYRLTVLDTITNTAGLALEGNGASASNWVSDFVVVPSGAVLGSAATVSVGTTPYSVAVGDFNGDGKPDLVVANYGTSTSNDSVQVLLGNGNGTFTAQTAITNSTYVNRPYAVAVGDFNGDGKLDLAVANYGSGTSNGTVAIFLGNGNGTFTASSTVAVGRRPYALAVGDFGNGHPDLVVANYGSSTNNDSVQILLNNGNGAFAAQTAYTSNINRPEGVAVGYFNGASQPLDVAVANNGNSTVAVLVGNGSGGFSSSATYSSNISAPTCIAVGDLNGDGSPDIVVGNSGNNTVGILLNNGNGTFANAVPYSTGGTTPKGVAIADFNGDGKPDVVVTNNASGTIGVLLNSSTSPGTFLAATTFSTGSSSGPRGVAVGDFNGDGKPDVAVADSSTNAVAVLLNTYGPTTVPLTTPDGLTFNVAVGQFGPGEFVSSSGTGSFGGESNAFNGYGRLYVGGSLFSPTTGTYSTADSGQSLLLGSGTAAGLTVSGEVTVPDTGSQDFARTIDTFTNSTGSSIATTVEIVANLGSNGATTVFATSDGSGVVGTGDQWIGTNGNGTPAVITYLDGPLSLQPISVSLSSDDLQWTYNITVAAGTSVSLGYFTIVAPTTTAAEAAANVLVSSSGLGGQAGAFLSPAQLQSLVNFANPSPVLTPPPASTEGTAITNVNLLHFYDTSAGGIADDTATITWGDGTVSTSTLSNGCQIVVDPNGGYDLLGTHIYAEATTSPITLSVQVTNGAGTISAGDSNFSVLDAPLTAGALTPPAADQGVAFNNVVVFHFTDANSYAAAGNFSATITWGDGTFSTVTSASSGNGQIVADAGGFDVLGSHLYTQQLSGATFSVQVTDEGGASTSASQSNFSVADAPLVASGGLNISFAQGQAIDPQTVVATFTDPGGAQAAGNYSATIDWGDGTTPSVGSIAVTGGVFTVTGGHSYSAQDLGSPYTVVVSIVHNSMSPVTVTDTASITGPHTMAWAAAGNGDWTANDWENLPPSYPDATIDVQVSTAVTVTVSDAEAANSLTLSNGATVVIAAGASLTVTQGVQLGSGAAVIVESGGTLVLSALGNATGAAGVTLDGGTLEAGDDFTTTVPVSIGAGGGTINTNGFNVTLAGNLLGTSGSGTLTETGGSTLTLSGSNTDPGGTAVASGTLVVASPSALSSSGVLNVGRSGSISLIGLLASLGVASPAAAAPATTAAATPAATPALTPAPATAVAMAAVNVAPSDTAGPAAVVSNAADASLGFTTPTPPAVVTSAAEVAPQPVFVPVSPSPRPLAALHPSTVEASGEAAGAGTNLGGKPANEPTVQARAHDVVLQSRRVGRSSVEATSVPAVVNGRLKRHLSGKPGPTVEFVDAALAELLL